MKLKNFLLLFTVFALVAGLSGCIFSPDNGDETPQDDGGLPPAVTTDILMDNFKKIYEGMLYAEYEAMLHPNYRTILLNATIEDWQNSGTPLDQAYFDRDTELQIHRNIFDNLGGVNEDGEPVDPIESIKVIVLDKIGVWTNVNESNENFGGQDAYWNRFQVFIHFEQPNSKRFEVDQQVDFYAKQVDGIWKMLGQEGYVTK
jgi:hypothetical protein